MRSSRSLNNMQTLYFESINSNIVINDSFLCASYFKVPFSNTLPTPTEIVF